MEGNLFNVVEFMPFRMKQMLSNSKEINANIKNFKKNTFSINEDSIVKIYFDIIINFAFILSFFLTPYV